MEQGMRTILVKNARTLRFDLCDPSPDAEDAFERVSTEVLKDLYPDCHVIQFKPTIRYAGEGWKPDLAVVERNCCFWFVVEVEIAGHSLEKHVLPQVRAFRLGDYGQEAECALAEGIGVTVDQAATILRYVPRYIAVINNCEDDRWRAALEAENVQFMTIASYGGCPDKSALLVNGGFYAAEQSLGFGKVYATQQAIMVAPNPFWREQEYRISEPGGTGSWACILNGKSVWLTKNRGIMQMVDNTMVQIMRHGDTIELRPLGGA
jgi:hypothetical protein